MQLETEAVCPIPDWEVVAENDAVDSGNPIHSDDVARKFGFRGGLVPGVTVYGYMTHPLVAHFGRAFLEGGFLEVRLRQPVYEGERVHVEVRQAPDGYGLTVRNPAGEACAVGQAVFPSRSTGAAGDLPAWAALPDERRPPTPETLDAHPTFGAIEAPFDAVRGAAFAARAGEGLSLYEEVAHPAWLLRQANYIVDRNLDIGPWIHVSSRVEHLGTVRDGETVQTRARVLTRFERKGHDYADLDVVLMTDRPVMRVVHRAIYRMGEAS